MMVYTVAGRHHYRRHYGKTFCVVYDTLTYDTYDAQTEVDFSNKSCYYFVKFFTLSLSEKINYDYIECK